MLKEARPCCNGLPRVAFTEFSLSVFMCYGPAAGLMYAINSEAGGGGVSAGEGADEQWWNVTQYICFYIFLYHLILDELMKYKHGYRLLKINLLVSTFSSDSDTAIRVTVSSYQWW